MKKLYQNIEKIHIKGGIGQLTTVVSSMDKSLQNIANNTEQLTGYLARFSTSNKGVQYEKMVNTSMKLRDELFQASRDLNDMQRQIVEYQNKICRYEEIPDIATAPNPYLVSKKMINVDTAAVQFTLADMNALVLALRNYSGNVFADITNINRSKNAIASVWIDPQYKDFSEFVDDVTKTVVDALKVFEEYVIQLEEKIKELS